MKIEQRKVESLIPYVNNSRKHSDEQVAQIAASIKEFGWTNPILVDGNNGIIAGHGRLMAARKLAMDKVPVIELAHLSDGQRKALIIADNKLALNSDWDFELLKIEMANLDGEGFNLDIIGFDANELSNIMFGEELNQKELEEKEMKSIYEIAVECKDENEQQSVFDMLTEKGYKCRVLTM